tara:strand:- start:549 stop:833 length:285 start_codon:yes stop_codon:yes gene_type:complete
LNKQIDISLIVPPAKASSLRPPLGLMSIASCLREKNIGQFANYDSFDSFLNLIEKKYRLTTHNIKLQYLFNEMLKDFPTSKNFHVKNIVRKEYF